MTDRSSAERSDEGSNGSEGNTRPVGAVDGSPNAGEMRRPSASAQVPPHREHSVSNGDEEGRSIDEEGVTSTIEDNARQGPSSGISVEQMRVPVMAQSPSSLHKTPSEPHRAESGGEKSESGRISLQAQEKHSEVVRGEGRRRHSKDEISGEDQRSSEDEGRMEKQRKGHRGHRERRREEGEDEKRDSGHGRRREESRRSSSGERRQYDGDREKSRRKRNRDEKRNKRSNEERNNERSPSPKRKERTEKRRTEEFDEGAHNKASPKMDNAEKVEQVSKEKKEPLDLLRTRTGGAYIPPAKLKMLQEQIADKNSEQYQRMNWERLKKKIHGQVNKANTGNLVNVVRDLLQENIIRGKGLLARSIIQAQSFSPTFSNVYAALVAIINSKFPHIGELILRRLIVQFKRCFRRNDKTTTVTVSKFIAHLINQQVAHEVLALELMILLLENPTDDSVEVTVAFLKECGAKLTELSPRGVNSIFDRLRSILNEAEIDKRVQYMIEVIFHVRRDKFQGFPAVIDELDLIDEDDQITHTITLEDAVNPENELNVFKYDPDFEKNEAMYDEIRREIIGEPGESSEEEDEEAESGEDADMEEQKEEGGKMTIIDNTEQNLVAFRRNVYLTIQSSLDFQEAAHKLLKIDLKSGQDVEMCNMIVDCCAQQRTYENFYGLLAERFCRLRKEFQEAFERIARDTYNTIHRFEITKLRNMARLVAHLLSTDAISWEVLDEISLNEEDTTSAGRIYIKIVFQELAEFMSVEKLMERIRDPTMQNAFEKIFPRDNPNNTRFSINFFTSIGLGYLSMDLRKHLQQSHKKNTTDADDSSSTSSSSDSDSSDSDSDSSSDSSESDSDSSSDSSSGDEKKKRSRKKKKRDIKQEIEESKEKENISTAPLMMAIKEEPPSPEHSANVHAEDGRQKKSEEKRQKRREERERRRHDGEEKSRGPEERKRDRDKESDPAHPDNSVAEDYRSDRRRSDKERNVSRQTEEERDASKRRGHERKREYEKTVEKAEKQRRSDMEGYDRRRKEKKVDEEKAESRVPGRGERDDENSREKDGRRRDDSSKNRGHETKERQEKQTRREERMMDSDRRNRSNYRSRSPPVREKERRHTSRERVRERKRSESIEGRREKRSRKD